MEHTPHDPEPQDNVDTKLRGDRWRIIDRPIGYSNQDKKMKEKLRWIDADSSWCFSKFLKPRSFRGKIIGTIGLFKTWMNGVGPTFHTDNWHAWIPIIRKLPGLRSGHNIIIWDPNFILGDRLLHDMLISNQWRLINDGKRCSKSFKTVCIGGPGHDNPEAKCQWLSLDRIRSICNGTMPFPAWDEMEEGGF
ncbi:hypothetical protein BDZ45DRAFT_739520 [Acephala macrosclerotiorum]|nr:hypothetical protein BDZ45DRAFT_739520 [Acephala macrosclerotiorum]